MAKTKEETKDVATVGLATATKRKVQAPVVSGVVAFGPYKPGETYEVDAAEAERLVKAKGFKVVE